MAFVVYSVAIFALGGFAYRACAKAVSNFIGKYVRVIPYDDLSYAEVEACFEPYDFEIAGARDRVHQILLAALLR